MLGEAAPALCGEDSYSKLHDSENARLEIIDECGSFRQSFPVHP